MGVVKDRTRKSKNDSRTLVGKQNKCTNGRQLVTDGKVEQCW